MRALPKPFTASKNLKIFNTIYCKTVTAPEHCLGYFLAIVSDTNENNIHLMIKMISQTNKQRIVSISAYAIEHTDEKLYFCLPNKSQVLLLLLLLLLHVASKFLSLLSIV